MIKLFVIGVFSLNSLSALADESVELLRKTADDPYTACHIFSDKVVTHKVFIVGNKSFRIVSEVKISLDSKAVSDLRELANEVHQYDRPPYPTVKEGEPVIPARYWALLGNGFMTMLYNGLMNPRAIYNPAPNAQTLRGVIDQYCK
jgi:hypothetical protein